MTASTRVCAKCAWNRCPTPSGAGACDRFNSHRLCFAKPFLRAQDPPSDPKPPPPSSTSELPEPPELPESEPPDPEPSWPDDPPPPSELLTVVTVTVGTSELDPSELEPDEDGSLEPLLVLVVEPPPSRPDNSEPEDPELLELTAVWVPP